MLLRGQIIPQTADGSEPEKARFQNHIPRVVIEADDDVCRAIVHPRSEEGHNVGILKRENSQECPRGRSGCDRGLVGE